MPSRPSRSQPPVAPIARPERVIRHPGEEFDLETMQRLKAARRWALDLEPAEMAGVTNEVRMLRQSLRDAFVLGDHATVRQQAEVLRRLLRDRSLVPEIEDREGDRLEDGLSADLRRVLQRVGLEMGVDA